MDASKKSAKPKFLAPGMLGRSKQKDKVSFGFPGYLSTGSNEGSPATNVSKMPSSTASLSRKQEGINTGPQSKSTSITGMGQSPSIESVVTTKPIDGFSIQALEDLFAAGYKLTDILGNVPMRPELGNTVTPSFENVLPFARQSEASKWEEEESVQASEEITYNHLVDTDIHVVTKRKRVTADARPFVRQGETNKWAEEESLHASEENTNTDLTDTGH